MSECIYPEDEINMKRNWDGTYVNERTGWRYIKDELCGDYRLLDEGRRDEKT